MLGVATYKFLVRHRLLACCVVAACSSTDAAPADVDAPTDDVDAPADVDARTAGAGEDASRVGRPWDAGAPRDAAKASADASSDGAVESESPHDAAAVEDASDSALSDASARLDAATQASDACTQTDARIRCTSRDVIELGQAGDLRKVYWAQPSSPPPAGGYPTVLLFQGSYFGPSTTWDVEVGKAAPFGAYYQVALVAQLLSKGFVVIQPEAQDERFWTTNVATDFTHSADGVFIPLLLAELEGGRFGTLDLERLYATGMSSGGYMTSRMAVSFPGRCRALAIQSASYATCAGAACTIPAKLPADHPPTLFLHGAADTIVPIYTADAYASGLKKAGIETRFERDPTAGHEWLAVAPDAVTQWFLEH
jgi:pimeloyl-ACP methyl ester carboxylesterase